MEQGGLSRITGGAGGGGRPLRMVTTVIICWVAILLIQMPGFGAFVIPIRSSSSHHQPHQPTSYSTPTPSALSATSAKLMESIIEARRIEDMEGFEVGSRIDGLNFVHFNHSQSPHA